MLLTGQPGVVERTFGLLKSRFRCFHKSGGALQYSPETTCKIVATCAILHNIATMGGIPVEPTEPNSNGDDDPLPPLHSLDRSSAAEGKDVLTSRATISDMLSFPDGSFKAVKE